MYLCNAISLLSAVFTDDIFTCVGHRSFSKGRSERGTEAGFILSPGSASRASKRIRLLYLMRSQLRYSLKWQSATRSNFPLKPLGITGEKK